MSFDPATDYPLGTRRPDLVETPGGLRLDEVTLEAARGGGLTADEIRATPATLRLQAEVARAAGRSQLADNLERAAELASVPDGELLEIYTALRPGRSTRRAARGMGREARRLGRYRDGRVRPRGRRPPTSARGLLA